VVERGGTRWNEVGLGKPDLPRLIFLAQDPLANCEASWSRAIADSAGANSVHHCCPSRGGVGWGWGQFAETNKKKLRSRWDHLQVWMPGTASSTEVVPRFKLWPNVWKRGMRQKIDPGKIIIYKYIILYI